MATIYLATFEGCNSEWHVYPKKRIEKSAEHDIYNQHFLASCPEQADIILFATNGENRLGLGLFFEQIYRNYATKCVLFDSSDYPSPLVGGLCASWPLLELRDAAPSVGWCYFHPSSAEPYIDASKTVSSTKYLWSFVGSSYTHSIREKLLSLDDKEAYTRDTSSESQLNLRRQTSKDLYEKFRHEYIAVLYGSKFILCPRGRGASSMRIFEAMRAGRSPVIISDQWTPPPFLNWDSFSIRIKEKEIERIPEILRGHEAKAEEMGITANREWTRVLGQSGLFHHTVEACLLLLERQAQRDWASNLITLRHLLREPYNRELMRFMKYELIGRTKRWRQRP